MHPITRFSLAVLSLCTAMHVHGQCAADNLIVNGDFTGTEGELMVAPSWTGESTPDLND